MGHVGRTIRVNRSDEILRIMIEQNGSESHPIPVKRLYDLKSAAVYLGRKVPAVRSLVDSGQLQYISGGRGGKIFVDIVDLDAYIEREKTRAIHSP